MMGKSCTFFGHRDCPYEIRDVLRQTLADLIENKSADTFYVGRQGAFDRLAASLLKELSAEYPHIKYMIVLERIPTGPAEADFSNTILPDGIETVHPRYAISWRNKWMINQSDYVITCITRPWGGAAKFAEMARRQRKTVINLAENLP